MSGEAARPRCPLQKKDLFLRVVALRRTFVRDELRNSLGPLSSPQELATLCDRPALTHTTNEAASWQKNRRPARRGSSVLRLSATCRGRRCGCARARTALVRQGVRDLDSHQWSGGLRREKAKMAAVLPSSAPAVRARHSTRPWRCPRPFREISCASRSAASPQRESGARSLL